MPQARLPDINTAYVTYRREALNNLKSENYSACKGSLDSLNALLPKDYRVQVNTIEYNKKTNADLLAVCGECQAEISTKQIKVLPLLTQRLDSTLNDTSMVLVWKCSKCKAENKQTETLYRQEILIEPYFLSLVPEPPQRKDGLLTKLKFREDFTKWFWRYLNELEERMAQFRDDNWQKAETWDDTEIMDGGEEND